MAIEQQPQAAPAETPQEAPGPEMPVNLDEDPFGFRSEGEGQQEASLGNWVRRLMAIMGKKGAKSADEAKPPKGKPDVPLPDEDAVTPEQATRQETGAATAGETAGEASEEFDPFQRIQIPQAQLGSTRPLANKDYFNAPETQEVLNIIQMAGKRAKPDSWQEIEKRANSMDAKYIEGLLGRKPSLGYNTAELTRLRQLLDAKGREVHEFAQSLQKKGAENIGPTEMAEFQLKATQLVALQNTVSGLSSEAGRLLNALKIRIDSPDAMWRETADLLRQGGGDEALKKKIEIVAGATSAKDIQQAIQESFWEKTWKNLAQLRYSMMLSSVRTHVANVVGSAASTAYEATAIDGLALLNYKLARAGKAPFMWAQGKSLPPPAMSFQGYLRGLKGAVRGTVDGLVLAGQMLKGTADPATMRGKAAMEMGVQLRAGEEMFQGSRIPGAETAGKVLGLPSRALEAEDAVFRAINYNKRLGQLIDDRVLQEAAGFPEQQRALYQKYLTDPPLELQQEAKKYAQKLTFTNDPMDYGTALGNLAKGFAALQDVSVYDIPMGRYILPFVRTPANLLGYTMEQMGVGQVINERAIFKALKNGSPREKAEAAGRFQAAMGLMVLGSWLWENEKITGILSRNMATRKAMEASGVQANSVKVGDKYYSIDRLDPLGSILGTIASYHEISHELGDQDRLTAFVGTSMALADLIVDRSYMQSLSDLMVAIDRGAAGDTKMFNMAAATLNSYVVPSLMRDFRYVDDPYQRQITVDYDVEGGAQGLARRRSKQAANAIPKALADVLPFLEQHSEKLPPRIDWKGDFYRNDAGWWMRGFMPITVTKEAANIETTELLRNNVLPTRVLNTIGIPKSGGRMDINLLDPTLDPSGVLLAHYQQLVGKRRREWVEKAVSDERYVKLIEQGDDGTEDSGAGTVLKKALREGTEEAKKEFIQNLQTPGHVFQIEGSDLSVSVPIETSTYYSRILDVRKTFTEEGVETPVPGIEYRDKPRAKIPSFILEERVKPRF